MAVLRTLQGTRNPSPIFPRVPSYHKSNQSLVVGRIAIAALCLNWLGCWGTSQPEGGQQELVVFAAASLTDALEVLADSFEVAYPQYRIVLNVAATSLLARQIDQGAPADVFFSASEAWMQQLVDQDRVKTPRYPLSNRLVVAGRSGAPDLPSLNALLQQSRIALADPDAVPAGIYARQGLACAGLWERLRTRVIPVLDVRAALLAVRNGAADVAVVYGSDIRVEPAVRVVLAWPVACQPDILYGVAALKRTSHPQGSAQFVAFATDPGRAAFWERFGFLPR